MELREMKINIWKKWRRETETKKTETEVGHRTHQQKWLDKLEETVIRMKKETEERKRANKLYEERREKLLLENKKRQEEILRKDQESKERKQKKKMLEERWAMARWISQYIDENSEKWKVEKQERQENEKKVAEEWKKLERFEKIRILRERMEENKTVKVEIKPAKLLQSAKEGQADQAEHQSNVTRKCPKKDQAEQPECVQDEQPGKEASQDHNQAAHEDTDAEAGQEGRQGDDQAEQPDQGSRQGDQHGGQVDIGEQTSSSTPLTIRQPLTIPRAVARCVSFHDKHNNLQLLTSIQLGKAPRDRGQAEQSGDQAE